MRIKVKWVIRPQHAIPAVPAAVPCLEFAPDYLCWEAQLEFRTAPRLANANLRATQFQTLFIKHEVNFWTFLMDKRRRICPLESQTTKEYFPLNKQTGVILKKDSHFKSNSEIGDKCPNHCIIETWVQGTLRLVYLFQGNERTGNLAPVNKVAGDFLMLSRQTEWTHEINKRNARWDSTEPTANPRDINYSNPKPPVERDLYSRVRTGYKYAAAVEHCGGAAILDEKKRIPATDFSGGGLGDERRGHGFTWEGDVEETDEKGKKQRDVIEAPTAGSRDEDDSRMIAPIDVASFRGVSEDYGDVLYSSDLWERHLRDRGEFGLE